MVAMEWKEDTRLESEKMLVEWKDLLDWNLEVVQKVRKEHCEKLRLLQNIIKMPCNSNFNPRIFIEGRQVQNGEETLVGGPGIMEEANVLDGGFEYGAHGMRGGYGAGSDGGAESLGVGYGSGFGSEDQGRHMGKGNNTKYSML